MLCTLNSCEILEDDDDQPFLIDQYEPNDTRSESAKISFDTNIKASIFPAGDVDFYMITIDDMEVWDKIEFNISEVSKDLELSMVVYDGDGVELLGVNTESRGASLKQVMNTPGGTYYVRLTSRWPNGIGAYTFNVKFFEESLLPGRWQSGTLYYRYFSNGNGYTWDVSDDVKEEEAQNFTWTLEKSLLTHIHILEIGGSVPRVYTVKELTSTRLRYEDSFGVSYSFTRVD